jgi:antitoxin YobK
MSIQDLKAALALIEAKGEGDFEGEKPESLILRAESALGVKFPPTYREFLSKLGCGDFAGEEFYGLINEQFEDSSVPNGIWLTLNERRLSNIPKSLVLIYATGDGTYYAIDTSKRDKENECPVVVWHPLSKPDDSLETVATDFGKFFYDTIRRGN